MQVCHGHRSPLVRIQPGDKVIYYSPATRMAGGVPVKSFTAAGTVAESEPYAFDMGNGFTPFRRNVLWHETREAPIRPLLDRLDFTRGKTNWGFAFRFGVFKIGEHDCSVILDAMQAASISSLT